MSGQKIELFDGRVEIQSNSKTYYYNSITKQTTWSRPIPNPAQAEEKPEEKPEGKEIEEKKQGN